MGHRRVRNAPAGHAHALARERRRRGGRAGGRTRSSVSSAARSEASPSFAGSGERTITLDCDVLQADGGTRCAAITGACVALAMAFAKLVREQKVPRWPLRETVAAISVGICAGQAVLDLGYAEDAEADVDCNVVGTASGAFVEIQGTAERRPFSDSQLGELLRLAKAGLAALAGRPGRGARSAPLRNRPALDSQPPETAAGSRVVGLSA